ncbi:MAG TPA: TrkH family potassium uptake protein [Feifaniaceae bacterium]|nr:TrkH family potassium uptake protein [Feifaniaceae bacterium]
MNKRAISIYIGYLLCVEGIFMLPALAIAAYHKEQPSVKGFGIAMAMLLVLGALLARQKRSDAGVYAREGFVTVSLGWILISLFGALPFYISGAIPSFLDCWFETVSGFTTTGASILTNVEALPRGLLYWRSFTHWLGGMGVLVFMLAVVPLAKGSGETFHLLRAESPGPSVDKLAPTMRHTTRILYAIYIVLTLLQIVLLLLGGMPLFDSVVHTFGTAGTGGFSIKNASIGAYDSAYLQAVIGVFMALFGINFSVYYLILLRQFRAAFRNEEFRAYIGIMLLTTAVIAIDILPQYTGRGAGRAVLDSFFQVSSVMTTTGYATTNFDQWPQLSRYLLLLLMIIGASAGSTGGGVKVSRLIILWRAVKNQMQTMLRPRAVRPVRMDGKPLNENVVRGTYAFAAVYAAICLISMLLLTLDDYSMMTTVSAVLACINNIGPGLDLVGPAGNFAFFSPLSKIVLSLDMLLGRLEIFPMLLLCMPSIWRKA